MAGYLLHKGAETKADKSNKEIKERIDSTGTKIANNFGQRVSEILKELENTSTGTIEKIEKEGDSVVDKLRSDSEEIKLLLDELKRASKKLKLNDAVNLRLNFRVPIKFLPSDAKMTTRDSTKSVLIDYHNSFSYSLFIGRKLEEEGFNWRKLISYQGLRGKFEYIPKYLGTRNQISLTNVDLDVQNLESLTGGMNYNFLPTEIMEDFDKIEIGDLVILEKTEISNGVADKNFSSLGYEQETYISTPKIYTSFSGLIILKPTGLRDIPGMIEPKGYQHYYEVVGFE